MSALVGLVLVAHASELARGAASVARQMAPGVVIEAVGGFEVDGREALGTDVDAVLAAVSRHLDAERDVVVLGDLGSALMTAGAVLELLGEPMASRVRIPSAPFVEGAVTAAVRAASGAGLDEVAAAASAAVAQWGVAAPGDREERGRERRAGSDGEVPGAASTRVVLGNTTGLHARPAAVLARLVAGFDAKVTVNDVPAESIFELMKLAAAGGAELEVTAVGPAAAQAHDAVVAAIASGLGER